MPETFGVHNDAGIIPASIPLVGRVGLMRCRHTVPDWHRYVTAAWDGSPILAGCRLLVKDGEQVSDPRGIACAYWGHQQECPLYDGPERQREPALPRGAIPGASDQSVAPESVWPVRRPGSMDGQRFLLLVLGALSIVLLGWATILGASALSEMRISTGLAIVAITAGVVSFATHVLSLLRLWVGR
jgi:hypothetical protein